MSSGVKGVNVSAFDGPTSDDPEQSADLQRLFSSVTSNKFKSITLFFFYLSALFSTFSENCPDDVRKLNFAAGNKEMLKRN